MFKICLKFLKNIEILMYHLYIENIFTSIVKLE